VEEKMGGASAALACCPEAITARLAQSANESICGFR
jgi:hypothetical protein